MAPKRMPNSTSPVMVTVVVTPPRTALVLSPTASPALSRVALSTATSPGCVGPRPSTSVKAGSSFGEREAESGCAAVAHHLPVLAGDDGGALQVW